MPRCRIVVLLILGLSFLMSGKLFADVTGSISGTVHDATGAVVPGTMVTITETATNIKHKATTDSSGQYSFLALAPGRYTISVQSEGFKSESIQNIVLNVNDQLRYDLGMTVGNVQQSVSVDADAVQVQTSSTSLGGTIESQQILGLPLNGRSYLDLLSLQAGVAPAPSSSAPTDRPLDSGLSPNAGNLSVNGQPESANAFLVNGADVSETKDMGAGLIPNIDSVAEFHLITNSFDAEYGRFTGGVMNTVTKAGTNQFHGDGFDFYRNDAMDAKGYLDPVKASLERKQFGYAMGGPFWRNRLFWFTDYQGSRQVAGVPSTVIAVPSNDELGGVFSPSIFGSKTVNGTAWENVLSARLGQPVTAGEPYTSVFPTGNISAAIDPIAAKEISFIHPGNLPDGDYSPAGLNDTIHDDKAGQRVDLYNKKTGDWSFYYLFDDSTSYNQSSASNYLPGFGISSPTRAQMFMLSDTKTIGTDKVNEARASFFRTATQTAAPDTSQVGNQTSLSSLGYNTSPSGLGIVPSGPGGYPQSVPPEIFNSFAFGNPLTNMKAVDNNYMLTDTFSQVLGNHSLKYGGELRYFQLNVRNVCAPNGQFTYTGGETGNDFADFLLGAPATYTQCSLQLLDNRAKYGGAYVEDSWKVKSNLTFNYGVRYEVSVPWYDKYNRLDTFIPGEQSVVFPLAPLGSVFPLDPGVRRSISPTFWNRFAPRLGIAYAPNFGEGLASKILGKPGEFSIRSSYGIYYLAAADNHNFGVIGSAPYGLYWVSSAQPTLDEPFLTRSNGASQTQRFPFTIPNPGDPANASLSFQVFEPIVGPGFDTKNNLSYAEHYTLSLQRQLSSSTVLTVAYVGTQAHALQGDYNLNIGDPALCLSLAPACGPNNEKQIFTGSGGNTIYGTLEGMGNQQLGEATGRVTYGHVHLYSDRGASDYNSLQVTVERRARDITFLTAYTYGKSLDNVSTVFLPSNMRRGRAVSPFDVKHDLVASYSWLLPFNRLFTTAPKRLVDGWSLSGITRFSTGFPITVSQSGDLALTGFSFDFPNYSGVPVTKFNPRSNATHNFFNKSAFTTEVEGVIGNSNPRPIYGPGLLNTDTGLTKTTRINDRYSFELRGEFFNVFNHAQFTSVQGNFASSQFGKVTAANPARVGQVSAKIIF
jgi:hypothetical protein